MEDKGNKVKHSEDEVSKNTKKTAFPVELYIYDLSNGMARQFAPLFGINFEIEGIWHTSLVVHGSEWFFGSQGIQICSPGGTSMGPPLRQEPMVSHSTSLSTVYILYSTSNFFCTILSLFFFSSPLEEKFNTEVILIRFRVQLVSA
jgi:hypothetical protein